MRGDGHIQSLLEMDEDMADANLSPEQVLEELGRQAEATLKVESWRPSTSS